MVDKELEQIGKRWKAARNNKGYSLEQVSAWLNVCGLDISIGSISRLERGRGDPLRMGKLIPLLCELYWIEPNDIYGKDIDSNA